MSVMALIAFPDISFLALLALLAGLLTLDDTSLAQTWFSQPLPAALLAGFFCGDPLTGLAIGLPLQLILAVNLPVGQSFTGEPAVATVAAVGASVLSGRTLMVPMVGAEPQPFGFVGWMVLAAGSLSALGHFLVQAERRAHTLWMLEGHRTLRDGNLDRMASLQARCLATTFLRGSLLVVLMLLFLLWAWIPLYQHLPLRLQQTLAILPWLLPGLGLGTLVDRYGRSRAWLWALAGLLLALAMFQLPGVLA